MRSLFLAAAAVLVASCSGTPAPPTEPPSDFSQRPALTGSGYAETIVVQDFPMERAELRAWLEEGNKIVAAMDGGDAVAGPVDAVYFDGDWPEPGATRRLELSDGHYVLEEVLTNRPEVFEYQVWNMTNEVRNNVDYIHGIQEFAPLPNGGTRMTWTYRVKPNAWFKRPFVQRFVDSSIQPMLSGALIDVGMQADELVANQQDAL